MIIIGIILLIALIILIIFSILAVIGIIYAHSRVFSRADYGGFYTYINLKYEELNPQLYPRELLKIKSGKNMLTGYLYGADNTKGLIIVSPGHRESNDNKLTEITYFADRGFMVLCYDYTGCYNSEGRNMVGYIQAPKDLDAVLTYVENNSRYSDMPVLLYGHSLGAYASTAVLQYKHKVTAVIAASGFDDPKEQWEYSIKRFTGIFGGLFKPYAGMFMSLKFGSNAHLSAIDGINASNIPILIISGTKDIFYGGLSKVYDRRNKITNPNCICRLMDKEGHNGHYDYLISDKSEDITPIQPDKSEASSDNPPYIGLDKEIHEYFIDFYSEAINKSHS